MLILILQDLITCSTLLFSTELFVSFCWCLRRICVLIPKSSTMRIMSHISLIRYLTVITRYSVVHNLLVSFPQVIRFFTVDYLVSIFRNFSGPQRHLEESRSIKANHNHSNHSPNAAGIYADEQTDIKYVATNYFTQQPVLHPQQPT